LTVPKDPPLVFFFSSLDLVWSFLPVLVLAFGCSIFGSLVPAAVFLGEPGVLAPDAGLLGDKDRLGEACLVARLLKGGDNELDFLPAGPPGVGAKPEGSTPVGAPVLAQEPDPEVLWFIDS